MPRTATSAVIAAAFASWAAEHHPDSPRERWLGADEQTALQREYDRRHDMVTTLLDPVKRAEHDASLGVKEESWLIV